MLRFFFSSKCSLFHNSNVFGSCIIHILYTGVLKFKKNNSGAKSLNNVMSRKIYTSYHKLRYVQSLNFVALPCAFRQPNWFQV